MFVCVTPNGDLDLTLRRTGASMEVEIGTDLIAQAAGGKGHNVARFLVALGHQATALGFAGGWPGSALAGLLRTAGVSERLTPIADQTRFFITVTDPAGTRECSYHQVGPAVTADEARRLLDAIRASAEDGTIVVLGGSLPSGLAPDFYARAIEAVRPARVALDCGGPPLRLGLEAGPWLVKVNRAELVGVADGGPDGPLTDSLARLCSRSTARKWWVTDGARGAIGWEGGALVRGRVPAFAVRNTSGAGDAFMAGLLHADSLGAGPQEAMRWALALASAVCELGAPASPPPERVAHFRTIAVIEEDQGWAAR